MGEEVSRVVPLSNEMERSVVGAILSGGLPCSIIKAEELSRTGRSVWTAVGRLIDGGARPPMDLRSVHLMAVEAIGANDTDVRRYLRDLSGAQSPEQLPEILRKVHDRHFLLDLINAAGEQLSGTLDVGELVERLNTHTRETPGALQSAGDAIKDGLPEAPHGPAFKTLPTISHRMGGAYGVVTLGGEPGAGKSLLAWQMAVDAGQEIPVLCYPLELTMSELMYRMGVAFKGNLARIRHLTRQVYVRDSIRTLDADLAKIKPPAMIVVDPVQSLPRSTQYSMEGLNRWIYRFEALRKRGYCIILVSEIPRSSYDSEPRLGDFKESGELEYKSDLAARLMPMGEGLVNFWVVKNRHRKYLGPWVVLRRHNEWWWKEYSGGMQEDERPEAAPGSNDLPMEEVL